MTGEGDAQGRARDLVRAYARDRQALRRDLAEARRERDRALLAAVEGLELLRGAAGDEAVAWDAVRERLDSAGVVLDGEAGEEIDLARHRVIQERRVPGREGRVVAVVSAGVVLNGRRLREAVVVAGAWP
ncbi:MAG TPA: hypothetical protein VII13_08220 [Vicinamibacteria bacterium]|jgi:hypothetical protein